MAKYRKVRAGDAFQFPAALQNDLIDLLSSGQLPNGAGLGRAAVAQGVEVMVKNTSGSDRRRWDTMALSTTLRFTMGADGKESVIFDAIASDPAKPPAILQEPIAANKFGRVLIFGYTLARVAAGSTSVLTAKPNASHKLAVDGGGTVRLLAAPSSSQETIIPVLIGFGGGGGRKHMAKLTASLASGTAAATEIYAMDGMALSYLEAATIYDPGFVFSDLVAGDWLYCFQQDGKFYASDNADCSGGSPLIDTPPTSGPPGEPV